MLCGGRHERMQRALISRGTWQVPLTYCDSNVRKGIYSRTGAPHQATNMKHAIRWGQVCVLAIKSALLIYVAAGLLWGILLTTPGEPVPTCSTAHLKYFREPSLLRFLWWARASLWALLCIITAKVHPGWNHLSCIYFKNKTKWSSYMLSWHCVQRKQLWRVYDLLWCRALAHKHHKDFLLLITG